MAGKKENSAPETFKISHTFDAPRDLVFRVWTDAKHLTQWWGPAGCKIEVAKLELRPGGMFHYSMALPDGGRVWGKFIYREVEPTTRLVFVNSFSDAEGGTQRHFMSQEFPLEVLNFLTFTEKDGKTTVTIEGYPINAPEAEVEFFHRMRPNMEQGFAGTFAALEKYLLSTKGAH